MIFFAVAAAAFVFPNSDISQSRHTKNMTILLLSRDDEVDGRRREKSFSFISYSVNTNFLCPPPSTRHDDDFERNSPQC